MANWKIMNGDEVVNTIVADKAFAMLYAEAHGYTAEEMPEPEVDPTPTTEERLAALEAENALLKEQLADTDEAIIALYEGGLA